jgi:hypothetical protein
LSYLSSPSRGVFGKFRKATINFLLSVRLSAWKNSALSGRIFMKFYIQAFLENRENPSFIGKMAIYMKTNVQGEHKIFTLLQTFITRKLWKGFMLTLHIFYLISLRSPLKEISFRQKF